MRLSDVRKALGERNYRKWKRSADERYINGLLPTAHLVSAVVIQSFSWHDSFDGWEFWNSVYKKLLYDEQSNGA